MTSAGVDISLINDCFAHDRDRMTHREALSILKDRLSPIVPSVSLPLDESANRILAETIESPSRIPPADNSAVDGFAFRHADLASGFARMPVGMRVAAGHPAQKSLPAGTAARIFTGAVMPSGTDSVAMEEDCQIMEEEDGQVFVVLPSHLRAGANRRLAGEDLSEGSVIAEQGQPLRPQDLAAIASIGLPDVSVFQKLRVALVSTGDELVRPGGTSAKQHPIYDANYYLLLGLMKTLPIGIEDAGIWPDNARFVEKELFDLSRKVDVIVTTGGASRGEEDHLVKSLSVLGKRHVWQLAIKPGRPMSFGQIGSCPVFALPGNPVATFICFCLYVRPALLRLAGQTWKEPRLLTVSAGFSVPSKKPDRREFLRGRLDVSLSGAPVANRFPQDGSGIITSLREADGLIVLPEDMTELAIGEPVNFLPFSEFGI